MGFKVLIEFWQDLRRSYFKSVWFGLKFTNKALIEFGLFGILKSCFCSLGLFVSKLALVAWSKFALFCLANLFVWLIYSLTRKYLSLF